jgi:transcriptional regulator with XRE-family HTH domain
MDRMDQEKAQKKESSSARKIKRLHQMIEALCGIYTRIARHLGVHRSMVSRVARGERRSEPIEDALLAEYDRLQER